jgi:hypothetical protein
METGWEKLKDRREKHKLVQFYKMTHNLTPHYISCLVPQAFTNIHILMLSHITSAYSNKGLTNVNYIFRSNIN